MATRPDILKQMKVGEVWRFPKKEYYLWKSAVTRLYCHGYLYKQQSKKEDDYLTITRLE